MSQETQALAGIDGRQGGVYLSSQERSTHLHVIGGSGSGKSFFLDSLMRQDARYGSGFCLIDPHGTLAARFLEWAHLGRVGDYRDIHLLQPSRSEYSFGFNPLRFGDFTADELAYAVESFVGAVAAVWGVENMTETPRLERQLTTLVTVLQANGLTLAEAEEVTRPGQENYQRQLLAAVENPAVAQAFEELIEMRSRERNERLESTLNRLFAFLASPVIRRMVGQTEHLLDTRALMDDQDILIVDLSPAGGSPSGRGVVSAKQARMIGTLLVNDLFLAAQTRENPDEPFYLYVDECYDYLTPDVTRILFEARKMGLHLTLAHQDISQLESRGQAIYKGVMSGARTKVLFAPTVQSDAELFVREILTTRLDPTRLKPIGSPAVTGHRIIELHNSSDSTSESYGTSTGVSEATASTSGSGLSVGEVFSHLLTEDGEVYREGESGSSSTSTFDSTTDTTSYSQNCYRQSGYSHSSGTSEALMPIIEQVYTQTYSIEEQVIEVGTLLRTLPRQRAILSRMSGEVVEFRTVTISRSLRTGAPRW